jgi:hypothetical protein
VRAANAASGTVGEDTEVERSTDTETERPVDTENFVDA